MSNVSKQIDLFKITDPEEFDWRARERILAVLKAAYPERFNSHNLAHAIGIRANADWRSTRFWALLYDLRVGGMIEERGNGLWRAA